MKEKKFYNLSNDVLFKSICSNINLLRIIMNDIFEVDLTGYYFENTRFSKSNKGLSSSENDLALTNGREHIIIEMQNTKRGNLENRTNIYSANRTILDWENGDKLYEKILPVRQFWFLNYKYHEKDFLSFHMTDSEILKRFHDGKEVNLFIIKTKHKRKILNLYRILFTAKSRKDIKKLLSNKHLIQIVKKILKYN